jgi:branched-chain amino acid transport system ATP-binding protein
MLKLNNIESYYGSVYVLKGISLEIEPGKIMCVLGANGAGKSTILKNIMGFIEPDKGHIEFFGERIEGLEPHKVVRKGISLVPEGREIFYDLSVKNNIMLGAFARPEGKKEIAEDFERLTDLFPVLKERINQKAGTLSGGEQQMLAMVRALMAKPKYLLLDEPSLGLSPLVVENIFEIIKTIREKEGTTILLVEQNANMALRMSDFGYVLENGRVVFSGSSKEISENENVREFYLGGKEGGVKGFRRYKRRKIWK